MLAVQHVFDVVAVAAGVASTQLLVARDRLHLIREINGQFVCCLLYYYGGNQVLGTSQSKGQGHQDIW